MATKSKTKLKNNKDLKSHKLLGRALIAFGALTILFTLVITQFAYLNPNKKQIILKSENTQNTGQIPTSVEILGKTSKINVQEGEFKYGVWQLSEENALHLKQSGLAGKPGNIVIYGHNTKDIFAPLHKAELNDIIELKTDKTQSFLYVVDSVKVVPPTSVEILEQGKEERVTIYTCTGLLDSMRLVISGRRA